MSNRIQFSNGVEISKGSGINRKQGMLSYAKRIKGNRRNRERREK